MWQHIEFINGGNPYICKTEKEFKKMQERYVLEKIEDGFWKATWSITYAVVGFADKNKMATYYKDGYKTKNGAINFIKKTLEENRFEMVVLRKVESFLKNNDYDMFFEIDKPIETFYRK